MPEVSVIIPCHGGVDDTRDCLRSLAGQVDAPSFEVIVVDNASDDGTDRLDREFPWLRVVASPTNRGFAGGVNLGAADASGIHLLVLNNDTFAAPHMLERLHRALNSDPRIGAVAPTSNHVKGAARVEVHSSPDHSILEEVETALAAHFGERPLDDLETLSGLCLLMRRTTYTGIGGFDERFGPGMFEDDDLCLRLRLGGARLVVVRDAFLHHRGHATFRRLGHDVAHTLEQRRATFASKWCDDPAGRAWTAWLAGDHDAAARLAPDALARYPLWPEGHLWLADSAAATGDAATALAHFDRYLSAVPCHGPSRVRRAAALIAIGRRDVGLEAAAIAMRDCHLSNQEFVDALIAIGSALVAAGDAELARPHLEQALELAADDVRVIALLGLALMESGRLDEAHDLLAVAAERGDANARNNLGICTWRRGDPAGAVAEFTRAVAAAPSAAHFRANLEAASAARDLRGA